MSTALKSEGIIRSVGERGVERKKNKACDSSIADDRLPAD